MTSPYLVICDAGSTGTRIYVYNHVAPSVGFGLRGVPSSSKVTPTIPVDKQLESPLDIHIQMGRKVKPGLSEQAPSSVADYILPSILDVVDMIPTKYHSNTPLVVYATGGMRMLPERQQKDIYDGLVAGLSSNKNVPFRIKRENFRTIEGSDEGYFAVLAVNYLAGRLGSDLRILAQKSSTQSIDTGSPVLGALDLGGASAQVAFYIADNKSESFDRHVRSKTLHRYVQREDFFSKSLLGFGTEPIRDKLELYVATQAQKEENSKILTLMDKGEEEEGIHVANPCYFRGYKTKRSNNTTHIGIGDGEKCMQNLNHIISKQIGDADNDYHDPLGAYHPSVQGDFYAMALYYYTFDFVRAVLDDLIQANEMLSPEKETYVQMQEQLAVSNPSLESLRAAANIVCSWRYEFLLEHKNVFIELTSLEKLPHRCLEFSHIIILLQKLGFFQEDNRVHFVHIIRNQTAEWTLGAFLDIMNNNQKVTSITNDQGSLSFIGVPMYPILLLVAGFVFFALRKKTFSNASYMRTQSGKVSFRRQKFM